MDHNNWRPSLPTGDWRSQLPPDSRHRIINNIMETLRKQIPSSGPEDINLIRRMAARFEGKIYTSSSSKTDYLRKISIKMLTIEAKSQYAAGSSSSIPVANNVTPMDSIHTNRGHVRPGSLVMDSAPLQGRHINQQSSPRLFSQQTAQSMLHQHQSSLLRSHPQSQQASGMHRQETQMMRQQAENSSGFQQNRTMGRHVVGDMQQQHQQNFMSQPNNVMNIQQQQPLGTQSNVAGLWQPQQQLFSSQGGNSSLQTNQYSVDMLSQPTAGMQRTHQAGHGLFSSQGRQQSQNQPSQQQKMPQLQSHRQDLIQQDVQQRLQVTGSLRPPQNVVDQQRQLYQSQGTIPEMPSSSLDSKAQTENAIGGDWQEEVYQKIKSMKVAYLPELYELYQRVASKLQQDSLLQQQSSDQFEKLKQFKAMLERRILFLSVPKSNIMPSLKDKVAYYEKQIIGILNMNKPQPMQQPQSQTVQKQSHDSQTNQQVQSMSMQGSGPRAQQSSLTNSQNNVLSSRPGVSAPQQNIPSSIPASSLESGQGNALNMGSMQQNSSQEVNNSSASARSGLSTLQSNVNETQLSSSSLQHQHRKQQQDQQMTQQLKQQFQQHPMQQQQLSVSPPQLLRGASPRRSQQHMSPKVNQKNLPSVNKMGTPLQSGNSPFVSPSLATPLAPPPMQVDSEKPSSLSIGNIARQQATGVQGVVHSLASGTPGISDENNLNPLTSTSEKPSVTELPIERLIRAVKSISPQALSSAVSDIGSVVRMVDRIAGSAPGNSSRASVGEDLVAMTKCGLQARNFMTTQEGMMATKKMKRHTTAMPLSVASLRGSDGDNFEQFAYSETSDLTSVRKKARTELWSSVRLPLSISEN